MGTENLHLDEQSLASFFGGDQEKAELRASTAVGLEVLGVGKISAVRNPEQIL